MLGKVGCTRPEFSSSTVPWVTRPSTCSRVTISFPGIGVIFSMASYLPVVVPFRKGRAVLGAQAQKNAKVLTCLYKPQAVPALGTYGGVRRRPRHFADLRRFCGAAVNVELLHAAA